MRARFTFEAEEQRFGDLPGSELAAVYLATEAHPRRTADEWAEYLIAQAAEVLGTRRLRLWSCARLT